MKRGLAEVSASGDQEEHRHLKMIEEGTKSMEGNEPNAQKKCCMISANCKVENSESFDMKNESKETFEMDFGGENIHEAAASYKLMSLVGEKGDLEANIEANCEGKLDRVFAVGSFSSEKGHRCSDVIRKEEGTAAPADKNELSTEVIHEDPIYFAMSTDCNRKISYANCKVDSCLPPSPIRGVIDSFAGKSKNHNNEIDSLKDVEMIAFSFQPPNQYTYKETPKTIFIHGVNETEQEASLSCCCTSEDSPCLEVKEAQELKSIQPERLLTSCTRKKLLVLDLNGLLADIVNDYRPAYRVEKKVGGKPIFKRPFCDDFLKFCFENFDIGIWSSRRKYNVESAVDYLMGEFKHNLLFCWDESRCTRTGVRTLENHHKPLVLKELKKLWNKEESDLPWKKGEYSPSNTLLVDDSPYKALCNPPHTAIFPRPYHFNDHGDNSLGPDGELRLYLEKLAIADDVQHFVSEHPFGQPAITASNQHWNFYCQIIESHATPFS
ncbi:hypothetical protein AXF42_Ash010290 [Apostasia shenzhenica]|uniref:Mitochondrial import inner membrane translocase subunit TIM50 n=1 Tax=Apostasia shenzhenica TaxID=1088818 RepID=A0A2I0BDL7_9ASPA|nr:hypothetical protein AXF42_Ash010290 [Apostasia shenzhenica]